MEPHIECCLYNVTTDAQTQLQESNWDIEFRPCLQRCGTCYRNPFFVVDGTVRTNETFDGLLDRTAEEAE